MTGIFLFVSGKITLGFDKKKKEKNNSSSKSMWSFESLFLSVVGQEVALFLNWFWDPVFLCVCLTTKNSMDETAGSSLTSSECFHPLNPAVFFCIARKYSENIAGERSKRHHQESQAPISNPCGAKCHSSASAAALCGRPGTPARLFLCKCSSHMFCSTDELILSYLFCFDFCFSSSFVLWFCQVVIHAGVLLGIIFWVNLLIWTETVI